jgi:hypothetical protein
MCGILFMLSWKFIPATIDIIDVKDIMDMGTFIEITGMLNLTVRCGLWIDFQSQKILGEFEKKILWGELGLEGW